MAEINEITVFRDSSGNPSYGLVDDQNRVVVTLDQIQSGEYVSGTSGSVTSGTEHDVVSYTVPSGKIFSITGWEASGNAHAVFRLYKGSSVVSQQRNSVADPNVKSTLPVGLDVAAGVEIKITVDHFESGKTIPYFGTIFGKVRDA